MATLQYLYIFISIGGIGGNLIIARWDPSAESEIQYLVQNKKQKPACIIYS